MIIEHFKSIEGIKAKTGFNLIEPDEHNDWINQGDRAYYDFISVGNKKDKIAKTILRPTAWVYALLQTHGFITSRIKL